MSAEITKIAWNILSWGPERLHDLAAHITPMSWATPIFAVLLSVLAMSVVAQASAVVLTTRNFAARLTHPVKYVAVVILTVIGLALCVYGALILPATVVYEIAEYSRTTEDHMTSSEAIFAIGVLLSGLVVVSLAIGAFAFKILAENER